MKYRFPGPLKHKVNLKICHQKVNRFPHRKLRLEVEFEGDKVKKANICLNAVLLPTYLKAEEYLEGKALELIQWKLLRNAADAKPLSK